LAVFQARKSGRRIIIIIEINIPMQAFGRNQIEVEKEVAFIH
jgi:hypothetical protein